MKSPLKDKPLRNPGQSVDDKLHDYVIDKVYSLFMLSIFMIIITLLEWSRWYFESPPSPWLYTSLAVIVAGYSVWKIIKSRRKIKSLKQGRDGEKAVGQYLDGIRETGVLVYHDIPAEGFNLDHVLIADSGVYVIETKTYSKPDKGEAIIVYTGKSLLINRRIETEKPIIQVKASAKWLSELLLQSTGKKYSVRGVVTFPGWFIQSTAEAKASDIWVLNPKALPAFIGNSKKQLSHEDQKLAAYHISRYIRTYLDSKP